MRTTVLLAVSAAAVLLTGAAGASSISSSSVIWASAPSLQDMRYAWPAKASGQPEGWVTLTCQVMRDATLGNCATASENPKGKGFARAAKELASKFKLRIDMSTTRKDQDYFVDVPFRFVDPNSDAGKTAKVTAPRWISMPDPNRIQAAFPKAAADSGVKKGVGVIDCATAPDGRLTDCSVSREDPTGLGFGEAAMTVAPIMQMNPWTDDGRPVDGARIKLPIQFELAGG